MSEASSSFVDDTADSVDRFSLDNINEGLAYLDLNGYVVFSNVADETQIKESRKLLWNYFESLPFGIKEDIIESWDRIPCMTNSGVISGDGVGQSEFLWYCRLLPNIRKIFSTLWKDDNLLTSFDGCGVFRPFHLNEKFSKWKSRKSWFHVDQNPITKPKKICVQGLLNLYDADESTGSLVVIPKSHSFFSTKVKSLVDQTKTRDFIMIKASDPIISNSNPKLVKAKAGDFLLWDSRTIHCNTPATKPPYPNNHKSRPIQSFFTKTNSKINKKEKENINTNNNNDESHNNNNNESDANDNEKVRLLRAVAYVCMTPRSFLNKQEAKQIISNRLKAVDNGITTNHWPHEFSMHIGNTGKAWKGPKINQQIRALIQGTSLNQNDTNNNDNNSNVNESTELIEKESEDSSQGDSNSSFKKQKKSST